MNNLTSTKGVTMKNFVAKHAPLVIETVIVLSVAKAFQAVTNKK